MKLSVYCLYYYLILLNTAESAVLCRQQLTTTKFETSVTYEKALGIANPLRNYVSDQRTNSYKYPPKIVETIGPKCTCPKSCSKHANLEPSASDDKISGDFDLDQSSNNPDSRPSITAGPINDYKKQGCKSKEIKSIAISDKTLVDIVENQTMNTDGTLATDSVGQPALAETQDFGTIDQVIGAKKVGSESDISSHNSGQQPSHSKANKAIQDELALETQVEQKELEVKSDDIIMDHGSMQDASFDDKNESSNDNENDIEKQTLDPATLDVPIIDGIFAFLPRKSPFPFETVLVQSPPIVL